MVFQVFVVLQVEPFSGGRKIVCCFILSYLGDLGLESDFATRVKHPLDAKRRFAVLPFQPESVGRAFCAVAGLVLRGRETVEPAWLAARSRRFVFWES